ncbi:putative redox protein, regulator of disulfide bond formation [Archaeoglobus sulfaticallidus PM70-1]|uniref:Putative redox protein, regulator of disulfide bond formation n=1 Tax=Archaeoglobus sulfaticallidus PM70-1 TaxID=387631 RepID=N0BMW0_9EURY|nr:OsmC family protein [Archaeoglobus sulfaticallidus]AGK61605.1 putative redox protein, regulator of disulfide bond formation [Archaeoglobus sulfaticallidus PM70-1]
MEGCCASGDKSFAKVRWVKGRQFVGISREHAVVLDQRVHEKGENTGFKPTELLLISVAGCLGTTIVSMCESKGVDVKGLEIDIEFDRGDDGIWEAKIKVGLDGVNEDVKEEIVKSADHLCKISNILRDGCRIFVEH